MKTLILSRFNVKYGWLEAEKQAALDLKWEEWLRERVRIFESWTFPSFQAQTYADTKAMMLFDSRRTPDWLREKIVEWQAAWAGFVPVFIDRDYGRGCSAVAVRGWLRRQGKKPDKLVTFWVDSDDIISPYYVERALQSIEPETKAMCFPTGYRITLGALQRGALTVSPNCFAAEGGWVRLSTQPGVSSMQVFVEDYTIEEITRVETVHWRQHPDVVNEMTVKDIVPHEPHFVKIVHDGAIVNTKQHWFHYKL